jgi:Tfp pilus assembly protein PilZ
MKSILIADNRADLVATAEPILKHWGYRVLSTQDAGQITTFIKESALSLVLIGESLLAAVDQTIGDEERKLISTGKLPTIALRQEDAETTKLAPSETLEVPLDLFELFSFIQRQVEKHPRQNLRLRLRLPGMYSIEEEEYILADVLNLSMRGLFFKSSAKVAQGDRVNVVFPLFGQSREIEVNSTVLYTIEPKAENNYFQGFGVGFDEMSEQEEENLQLYIREHFLKEVSASQNGVTDFNWDQLKN